MSEEEREAAARAFDTDSRDTSTPRAMAGLLARLWEGDLLSPKGAELLLDVMTDIARTLHDHFIFQHWRNP